MPDQEPVLFQQGAKAVVSRHHLLHAPPCSVDEMPDGRVVAGVAGGVQLVLGDGVAYLGHVVTMGLAVDVKEKTIPGEAVSHRPHGGVAWYSS